MADLTGKEVVMLGIIGNSDYHSELEGSTWSNCVCDNRSDAAVVGSLAKKGLLNSYGSGREATIELTEAGCLAFVDNFPQSAMAVDYCERKGLTFHLDSVQAESDAEIIARLRAEVESLNAAVTSLTRENIEKQSIINGMSDKIRRVTEALIS